MRAIFVDVKEREVYAIEIDGTLESLQKAVGGYIEYVRLEDREDLYVNEEGLLHGEQDFFTISGASQPFAGSGIIVGNDGEGGIADTKLSAVDINIKVKFMTIREALDAARGI